MTTHWLPRWGGPGKFIESKRRRIGDSHYEITVEGVVWGEVVKTGSHLDDYPWDWSLAATHPRYEGARRRTGTADTLKTGINDIVYTITSEEAVTTRLPNGEG